MLKKLETSKITFYMQRIYDDSNTMDDRLGQIFSQLADKLQNIIVDISRTCITVLQKQTEH